LKTEDGSAWIGTFQNGEKKDDFMKEMVKDLNLRKYYRKSKEKGFGFLMWKECSKEDFLEICVVVFGKDNAHLIPQWIESHKEKLLTVMANM